MSKEYVNPAEIPMTETESRYREVRDLTKMRIIPAKEKEPDFYDDEVHKRIAVYVRVSTDSEQQTSSYELQKKFYEGYVREHDNWTLVKIYADKGISGTSLEHRVEFNKMIADCKAGKIDIILTKSVSRFARNIVDCIGIARELALLSPAVGIFFEMEHIFSLNEDSQMALSFQATIAQEESHIKSRSMNKSYFMRFSNAIFLTPKLLGYNSVKKGKLTINEEQAPTVKLIFYMYICGHSTSEIAETLMMLGKKTLKGNTKWTSSGITQILRNERYCGDILTNKTYTPSYLDHKSKKNYGKKQQFYYTDDHDPIIPRDDFIAVQHMLNNARYRNTSILPELRVIPEGLLKGFVVINPRWAGFNENDYRLACQSVYGEETIMEDNSDCSIYAADGDFDMRGFEIARSEFFDSVQRPFVTFQDGRIKFSTNCIKKFGKQQYIEMLVHPVKKQFAVRITNKENRNAVVWAKSTNGVFHPRDIPTTAFTNTFFALFSWDLNYKYRVTGSFYQKDNDSVCIFDLAETEVFLPTRILADRSEEDEESSTPLIPGKNHIKAMPEDWLKTFGRKYYIQKQAADKVESAAWDIQNQGSVYDEENQLKVSDPEVLREFINQELSNGNKEAVSNE